MKLIPTENSEFHKFKNRRKNNSAIFSVPGEPVGKGRPKFSRFRNRVIVRTPEKTRKYEDHVRNSYIEQCDRTFITGVVFANITAYFPVPKSTSKKKRVQLLNGEYHTKKPDGDNIAKAVLDALNELAYKDDSAIGKLTLEKFYSEYPRVDVKLTRIQ